MYKSVVCTFFDHACTLPSHLDSADACGLLECDFVISLVTLLISTYIMLI